MELELLRPSRLAPTHSTSNTGAVTTKQTLSHPHTFIKLSKQLYSLEEILADPVKTRFYIDKLNAQLKEKVDLML
jgi:hypothetical protein